MTGKDEENEEDDPEGNSGAKQAPAKCLADEPGNQGQRVRDTVKSLAQISTGNVGTQLSTICFM